LAEKEEINKVFKEDDYSEDVGVPADVSEKPWLEFVFYYKSAGKLSLLYVYQSERTPQNCWKTLASSQRLADLFRMKKRSRSAKEQKRVKNTHLNLPLDHLPQMMTPWSNGKILEHLLPQSVQGALLGRKQLQWLQLQLQLLLHIHRYSIGKSTSSLQYQPSQLCLPLSTKIQLLMLLPTPLPSQKRLKL